MLKRKADYLKSKVGLIDFHNLNSKWAHGWNQLLEVIIQFKQFNQTIAIGSFRNSNQVFWLIQSATGHRFLPMRRSLASSIPQISCFDNSSICLWKILLSVTQASDYTSTQSTDEQRTLLTIFRIANSNLRSNGSNRYLFFDLLEQVLATPACLLGKFT